MIKIISYIFSLIITHKNKYSFQADKSTTQAILHFLILQYFDSGRVVITLFLNFDCTFDCVSPRRSTVTGMGLPGFLQTGSTM